MIRCGHANPPDRRYVCGNSCSGHRPRAGTACPGDAAFAAPVGPDDTASDHPRTRTQAPKTAPRSRRFRAPRTRAAGFTANASASSVAASGYDRRDVLPNVYLADGQASIRLRKLIKNVLFESQIDYKFVTGDISTFLRYKYYAHNFTYKIGVFDSISFGAIGSHTDEFERVRGGLLLLEFPRDYNHRYFTLLQDDRLTFGDVTRVDNRKNNIYTKFGYQYGTEFDERLNAIVGESRGRQVPVLTVFRELGPQKFSYAAALTESAKNLDRRLQIHQAGNGGHPSLGPHTLRNSWSRADISAGF